MTIPPEVKSKIITLIGDKLTCPVDMTGLNKVIDLKNKITKQLNNIYKGIDQITEFIKPIEKSIETANIAIPIAKNLVEVGGFIILPNGAPLLSPGTVEKAGTKLQQLDDIIVIANKTILMGTFNLTLLREELKKVLTLLDMLDIIVELCARETGAIGGGGGIDGEMLVQTQVSQELIASTQNQSNQLSPVVTNINGFDMEVETQITGDPLKRRRAVAKNTQGVAVLKGEYSYSSNDQILIDELVFYIQQNDLKAE